MDIAELAVRSIEKYGEYEALFFEGRWFTNTELEKRARRIAVGLSKLGIEKGDRVGKFQVPKRIEFAPFLPRTLLGKVQKKELRKQYFGR